MPFTLDYSSASERHFNDGKLLESNKRFDAAGYHYGFAAECAIKHALLKSHGTHTPAAIKGFKLLHFPNLKGEALLFAQGRAKAPIVTLLKSAAFFSGWQIAMRYAKTSSVSPNSAAQWRQDADKARSAAFF